MNFLDLIPVVGKVLDKIIPDPQAKAAAQLKLAELQANGELARLTAETDLARGQLEINKIEAGSASLFVSGWRPSIGWLCSLSLAYQFLVRPLLVTFGQEAPPLDMGDLLTILLGMLGLGGLRTFEKVKSVARK